MISQPYYRDNAVTLLLGDALDILRTLPATSVDCIVTSPPYYGLRDYGTPGQYGLEATPAKYVDRMRDVFAEARRVLDHDGTLWLNLGDSYAYPPGSAGKQGNGQRNDRGFTAEGLRSTTVLPPKNLLGIPWRVAFALQDDGWILRNEIIWHKPNAMPESIQDRLSNRHEHLFMLAKDQRYHFDLDAVRQPYTGDRALSRRVHHTANKPNTARGTWGLDEEAAEQGRNPGDVWSISTPRTQRRTSPSFQSICRFAASRLAAALAVPSSTPSVALAPPEPPPAHSADATSASTSTLTTTT